MKVDNQSAIEILKNNNKHSRAKHIDIRYHFIRNYVQSGQVKLVYCSTKDMLADIFTKPLRKKLFQRLRYRLGIRDGSAFQSQSGGVENPTHNVEEKGSSGQGKQSPK
jgi:hypothetical protein